MADNTPLPTDADVMAAYQRDPSEANLRALRAHFEPRLKPYARRLIRRTLGYRSSRLDAAVRDLLDATFAKIHLIHTLGQGRYRSDAGGSPLSWMKRLMKHLLIDWLRTPKWVKGSVAPDDTPEVDRRLLVAKGPGPDQHAESMESHSRRLFDLGVMAMSLPSKCWLIVRCDRIGTPRKVVAQALGVSQATVVRLGRRTYWRLHRLAPHRAALGVVLGSLERRYVELREVELLNLEDAATLLRISPDDARRLDGRVRGALAARSAELIGACPHPAPHRAGKPRVERPRGAEADRFRRPRQNERDGDGE